MPAITVDQAYDLAAQYQRSGDFAAAEAMCRRILTVAPTHRDALDMLATNAISTRRYEEALQWYSALVAHYPSALEFQCNLGVIHRFLGRPQEALRCFEKVLEIDPAHASGMNSLGDTLRQLGHVDEAIQHLSRALEIDPNLAEAHNNLAFAYFEKDRWDEAIASSERALAVRPGYAKAWLNRGAALMRKRDVVQAEQSFRTAIACGQDYADAHWNLSMALLLCGQYEEGWREFEWRRRSSNRAVMGGPRRPLEGPPWDGAPAEGSTMVVYSEQGLGDTIQFVRYLPLVRAHARARRVIFVCPASIANLFPPGDEWDAEILASEVGKPHFLEFDQHIALLSLPLALHRFPPLSVAAPYLRADPAKRAVWRERLALSTRTKVGLVWQGNPQHANDRHRSIDPRRLAPLLRVPNIDWYSLQVKSADEAAKPSLPEGLLDLTGHIVDLTDAAAFMAELDLIISVDTATAHLAGALGRPVWTLLPFAADWRWGLEGETTPWYSTMRLFRQKATNAWEEVIQRVAGELSSFCVLLR